jgi:hypothetical protein
VPYITAFSLPDDTAYYPTILSTNSGTLDATNLATI